jgi:hypothetical protein
MQCMPAATAASTPGTESSKNSTSSGLRLRIRAAVRKALGVRFTDADVFFGDQDRDQFTRRAAVQHRQHVLVLGAGDDVNGNPFVRQQFH